MREDVAAMKLDLDIEQFWKDDELAHEEDCFSKRAPQVALGIRMSDECVFAELGEEGQPWGVTPRERRIELNKRYNEKALKIVGRKLLREDYPTEDMQFPAFRRIGEVFGGQYVFDGTTEWLRGSITTPQELEKSSTRSNAWICGAGSCRKTGRPRKNGCTSSMVCGRRCSRGSAGR